MTKRLHITIVLVAILISLSFIVKHTNKYTAPNYLVVDIGNQTWMARNLDIDYFRNGDKIPQAQSSQSWESFNENKKPAWCYAYENGVSGTIDGKLYNWYAVSDPRGLAPMGYKIADLNDFENLYVSLGGAIQLLRHSGYWSKVCETGGISPFHGVPNKLRNSYGYYHNASNECNWWSTEWLEKHDGPTFNRLECDKLRPFTTDPGVGLSVRCVKDLQ